MPEDCRADTAVFETPIFLGARPTKPYKVVKVIKDQLAAGSLNANLQSYYKDAKNEHVPFDGIIVRDVNYTFMNDAVFMFRWKKN